MTNMLQDGAGWLAEQLKNSAGRTVTYSRAGIDSAAIVAVATTREYSIVDADGFTTIVQSMDWTFETADLLLRTEAIAPRRGDQITETLSGETVVWEVMPLGNLPCGEWTDTGGVMTTVHSKRVDQ